MNKIQNVLEFVRKPVQKNAGLFVAVKRFFTDINGTIIPKNTVPLAMQTSYPFWMFGQFDRLGGYKIGNQIDAPSLDTPYLGTFVYGLDLPFLFATGLNDVKNNLSIGDIIHVFTDSLDIPTTYCWIVQHNDVVGLGSVYGNGYCKDREKVQIKGLNYFVYTNGSVNFQFSKTINRTRLDTLGAFVNQNFDPLSYDQTDNKQDYFIQIPLSFTVDQYNLISSQIDFNIDFVQLSFILNKNTIKV